MNIFFLIYIAVVTYITIPICKIIWNDQLDNDLTFILCCNYLLIFILSYIFSYTENIMYSILISFSLVLASFILIRKIKEIFGNYQLLSIPYFCFCTFVFSNILVLI